MICAKSCCGQIRKPEKIRCNEGVAGKEGRRVDLGIAQRCHIRYIVCGDTECIYCRKRDIGQRLSRPDRRRILEGKSSILFSLVRAVCCCACVFLDAGRAFRYGDQSVADGNCGNDAPVPFLVFCRSAAAYPGRCDLRAGAVLAPDQADDGTTPPV